MKKGYWVVAYKSISDEAALQAYGALAVPADGTGYAVVHSFAGGPADGANPQAGLLQASNGAFYGTTRQGGYNGQGTIFELTLPAPPTLALQWISGQVVLTWTNTAYILQSAPQITGPYTNVLGAASPYTNTLTGPADFFRLISAN